MLGLDLKQLPEDEQEYWFRRKALENLWGRAISGMEVFHPDCRVDVMLGVREGALGAGVMVSFILSNLRDTRNPDKTLGFFEHGGFPTTWPGEEAAWVYITGLWALYLQHEAMELSLLKGSTTRIAHDYELDRDVSGRDEHRIVNPHEGGLANHHIKLLNNTQAVTDIMAIAVGTAAAEKLIGKLEERARMDVANEIQWLRDPTYF